MQHLNLKKGEIYFSSVEKMTLLIALMYREPSGSVTFSWVRGGMISLVKYLNAGLGDWIASWNTLKVKHTALRISTDIYNILCDVLLQFKVFADLSLKLVLEPANI